MPPPQLDPRIAAAVQCKAVRVHCGHKEQVHALHQLSCTRLLVVVGTQPLSQLRQQGPVCRHAGQGQARTTQSCVPACSHTCVRACWHVHVCVYVCVCSEVLRVLAGVSQNWHRMASAEQRQPARQQRCLLEHQRRHALLLHSGPVTNDAPVSPQAFTKCSRWYCCFIRL